ncbi:MAG: hypothetical protein FWD84_00140 [Oscillospiraceae bacterium]|nr:hypothetical protein [Oscillospiraceae bacterium]
MKKALLFALIAILLVTMFTGCRAYRRTTVTTPGYEVTTNTDGRTTRGVDGLVTGDGVTRNYHTGTSTRVTPSHHGHTNLHTDARHDGRVTDTDGIIGNGTFADRPAAHGTHSARRPVDGVDRPTGIVDNRTSNFDINPAGVDAYRMGGHMAGTLEYVR